MANTANIDLVKPAGTDHALISVINSNSDKIDAEAGRQRGNFAGTYSSTSGYAVGDYCIYQGNLYRCTTAIGSSGENWTAGHWTSVKVGTELKGLSDQIGTLNSNIANVATDVANSAFCATGASGSGTTSASITLPVGALFDSLHPIFVISIYRASTTDSNEGYCIMKIDGTSVYITKKTGLENVTGATYNSTTRVLTITCGAYRTFLVFGQRTSH